MYAAREAAGITGYFVLDAPATPERLRLLCSDEVVKPYAQPDIRCGRCGACASCDAKSLARQRIEVGSTTPTQRLRRSTTATV